jgi:hypothetical protein
VSGTEGSLAITIFGGVAWMPLVVALSRCETARLACTVSSDTGWRQAAISLVRNAACRLSCSLVTFGKRTRVARSSSMSTRRASLSTATRASRKATPKTGSPPVGVYARAARAVSRVPSSVSTCGS